MNWVRQVKRCPSQPVLAALSAIVLALCEERTGLAISGVFGAGKTRSAAVLLAGLLVFDPSLKLMVLTKQNIAAHAVAEHLVSLQMPGSPGHERSLGSSYSYGHPHVWCWACLGGPSPLLSSWWRTLQYTARWNFHPHAPAELQSNWPAFFSPGNCGGTARLCHALPQGSVVAPHCCGLVAALEVQHCTSQGNHWSTLVYFSLWCHAPRESIQA